MSRPPGETIGMGFSGMGCLRGHTRAGGSVPAIEMAPRTGFQANAIQVIPNPEDFRPPLGDLVLQPIPAGLSNQGVTIGAPKTLGNMGVKGYVMDLPGCRCRCRGMALQAIAGRNTPADQAAAQPSLRCEYPPVVPGIPHNGTLAEIPGTCQKTRMPRAGRRIAVLENRARHRPQPCPGSGRPAVIAAVDLLDARVEAISRCVAKQTVGFHDPAFAEVTPAVRRHPGGIISVQGHPVRLFTGNQVLCQVGTSLRSPPVLQRTAAGMAGAAGP